MKVRRFHNLNELQSETAALIAAQLMRHDSKPHAIMLSGGKTPLPIYQQLVTRAIPVTPIAHILFSDERVVPADSPDSNYGNIAPAFKALGLEDKRILRVETEQGLEKAAAAYDHTLNTFLQSGRITLGLLGLGADGHTASLFNAQDILRGHGQMAIPVPKKQKPDRISVTPAFLKRIDHILFLATGQDKAPMIKKLTTDPMSIPAGQAVAQARNVELWTC